MKEISFFLVFLALQGCNGGGGGQDGGADGNDRRQVYDSCDYTHYTLYIVTAEAQSGDRVVFHKRMYSPDIVGGSMPTNLAWAQATVSGTTRTTDDYFSLVYSADHHNWNEGYTVLLNPPVDDVFGLVLLDSGYNDDPVEMLYLGSDYTEIRKSPLVSYTEVKQ
jgi:hypothetical protein